MNKLLKFLLVVTVVANLAALVYFINDSMALRRQIADISNIRIQLPEEFKRTVADQTVVSTRTMAKETLDLASKVVSEEAVRTSEKSGEIIARLAEGVDTNLRMVVNRLENEVGRVDRLCLEHEGKRSKKVSDAEASFAHYASNPSNEVAMLNLQVAIRKNPSELKYIKAMRDAVVQSGMDAGLVQEYQAMLSYCLDETGAECVEELTTMVKDLRDDLAKMEIRVVESDEAADKGTRIAELREWLSTNGLVLAFDAEAEKIAARRAEVLKELMTIDESGDYEADHARAELVRYVAKTAGRINGYMKQAEWEIAQAARKGISSEDELREVLAALGSTAVSQPILLAQQAVQSLYGMDLTAQPTNVVKACAEEFRILDRTVLGSLGDADKVKLEKINAFVNGMDIVPVVALSVTCTYTDQLKKYEKQGKILSKYIGCISNAEIANGALAKQLEILEKSKEVQRKRMKCYQETSSTEMKEIAKLIKKYKDEAWRAEYKKNNAIPLLRRLVRIDPALLVPEIQELYQYEYSQLTADFNAWIEKENDYEYKARFMVELEGVEKNKLEDL